MSLGDGVSSFAPKVDSLKIIETTKSSLTVEVRANITNPTNYSATVPYVDLHLLSNGTLLGHATGRNLHVVPGNNTNITVIAVWDPLDNSGHKGVNVSRALISRYISGERTQFVLLLQFTNKSRT